MSRRAFTSAIVCIFADICVLVVTTVCRLECTFVLPYLASQSLSLPGWLCNNNTSVAPSHSCCSFRQFNLRAHTHAVLSKPCVPFTLPLSVQIRWAKWSLERVRVKAGRGEAGRPLEHGNVLAHQLSHFVNTLHQFVMDRLLHGAWLALEQVSIATCNL